MLHEGGKGTPNDYLAALNYQKGWRVDDRSNGWRRKLIRNFCVHVYATDTQFPLPSRPPLFFSSFSLLHLSSPLLCPPSLSFSFRVRFVSLRVFVTGTAHYPKFIIIAVITRKVFAPSTRP
ncbi:hypothetical protein PUN28_004136 [Cardiocondyla obscurior]|uniref:Uncharacterized protein n=1 Tax=Cardiocondyla obscurior TaxID=286306 RepID=A0AAW2GPR7_9HYME